MTMDGSASVDVGAQLNWLEQRTEEMVTTATDLAAQYEASSRTFDATLREAEAKIKQETDAKLEESIKRYTEAVKQHAISVHRHTDAGPFVLHLMEAVAFHRMNVRMVRQRFCAESIGILLAPILSQGKNAFTITGFLKVYSRCMTRDVCAEQDRQIEAQQRWSEVTAMNRLESQLEERQKIIDKQDVMIRELVEVAQKKEPPTTATATATVSPRPGVPQMGLGPFSVHIPRPFTPCGMSLSGSTTPPKRPLSISLGTSLSDLLSQSRPSTTNHVSVPKKPKNAEEVRNSHRAGGTANATGATNVVPPVPDTGKESAKSTSKPRPSVKSTNVGPTLEPESSAGSNAFFGKPKAPQGSSVTPAAGSGTGASVSAEERNRVARDLGNLFIVTSDPTDDDASKTDATGESAGALATMAIQDAGTKKKKKRKKKKNRDRDHERRRDDAPMFPVPGTGSPPKAGTPTPSKATASKLVASKPGTGASAVANPFEHGSVEYRRHHQWEVAGPTLVRYRESLGITSSNVPKETDASHVAFLKIQMQLLHGLLAIQTLDGYAESFKKMTLDENPKRAEKGRKYAKVVEAARNLSFKGTDPKKCYPLYLAAAFEYYEEPNDVNRALVQEDDQRGWAKENMPGLYQLFISQLISRYSMSVPKEGGGKTKMKSEGFSPFCSFKNTRHDAINDHIRMHLRMLLVCWVGTCFHIEVSCATMWTHAKEVHGGVVKLGRTAVAKKKYRHNRSPDEDDD